jgi:hypothetical protein
MPSSDYVAFTTTAGAARSRAAHIWGISVTSAVTGTITIYDNPSAASGPVLYSSATNPVGYLPLDIVAKFGVWVVPGSAGGFNLLL